MPNIAAVLKEEISRIARKESRKLVDPLKKQVAAQRRDLAALKKERAALKSQLAAVQKASARAPRQDEEAGEAGSGKRFSPAGLQSLRKRMGLAAHEFGRLVGVSGQSVYNWEQGKSRPRRKQVESVAALRGVGKREARARLEQAPAASRKRAASGRKRRKAG